MAGRRGVSGSLLVLVAACLALAAESREGKAFSAASSNVLPLHGPGGDAGNGRLRALRQENGGQETGQACAFYSAAEDAVVEDKEQEELDRKLWGASGAGELERVKEAVRDGACIDAVIEVMRPGPIPFISTTAVEEASSAAHTEVALFLLDSDADPGAGNATGLFSAAANGDEQLVRAFVEAGADLEAKQFNDVTVLVFTASFRGATAMVKLLLELGADVNATNSNGATSLFIAAQQSDVPVATLLLEAGADVDKATTTRGATPLIVATQKATADMFQLLLDEGADPALANDFGTVPLHLAAFRLGKAGLEMTTVLLDLGVDIEARDEDGRTPLMWAARFGNPPIAALLLEQGADASAKDNDGRTAEDLICDCLAAVEEPVDEETGFDKLQCPDSGCGRNVTAGELMDVLR